MKRHGAIVFDEGHWRGGQRGWKCMSRQATSRNRERLAREAQSRHAVKRDSYPCELTLLPLVTGLSNYSGPFGVRACSVQAARSLSVDP